LPDHRFADIHGRVRALGRRDEKKHRLPGALG
jgi:hypothetical protein